MKPLIGIIGHKNNVNGKVYASIYNDYITSVHLAGGIPIIIPLINDESYINELIPTIDGLLIPGGVDIHPNHYNQPIKHLCGKIDTELDAFEMILIKKVLQGDIPVLGICRGHQLLNVAYNGTLHQDITYFKGDNDTVIHEQDKYGLLGSEVVHEVKVAPKSMLYQLCGEVISTNSYHHQIIDQIGTGLDATAQTADGVVEAIEARDKRFVLGVQWHPEKMAHNCELNLNIFHGLIHAAEDYKRHKAK